MQTMWCPECGSEYREGIVTCADCGTALTDEPPPATAKHHKVARDRTLTGPFRPDDDLVELVATNAVDAEMFAARLRDAGIQAAVFGVGTAGTLITLQYSEGSRVMVRRADRDAADKIIADLAGVDQSVGPIDDDTLASLADKSKGWSDPSTGAVV